jgi:hypothetical protein
MTVETTHRDSVAAKLQEIPAEKLSTMVARFVLGLLIAATGIFAKRIWPGLPDLVAYATFGFGLITLSGQLLTHSLKHYAATIRDFVDAARGKNGGGP